VSVKLILEILQLLIFSLNLIMTLELITQDELSGISMARTYVGSFYCFELFFIGCSHQCRCS